MRLKNKDDIYVLNKTVNDIDFWHYSNINWYQETLKKQIASSKYLNDIVIYYTVYLVLNENVQSCQQKRSSEIVDMGSIFR